MLGTILGYIYAFTLGIYVGTEMGSLYDTLGSSNDGKIEGLFLVVTPVYSDKKVLGSDEGIKLGSTNGKLLGTILVDVDGITLGINFGTELVSLDKSVVGSNNGYIEGIYSGDSLKYTDDKVIGSDEGIKLLSIDGQVIGDILRMYLESHF